MEDQIIMPKKSLFKKPTLTVDVSPGVSPNDEIHIDGISSASKLYGITVNVQPTKLMNKKQWFKYNKDQQMAILGRIEKGSRKGTPSIELKELNYETCPKLGNIHFHALYSMPKMFISQLEAYYKRVLDSSDEFTKTKWRYLDIKIIVGTEDNWLQYIRKDKDKA